MWSVGAVWGPWKVPPRWLVQARGQTRPLLLPRSPPILARRPRALDQVWSPNRSFSQLRSLAQVCRLALNPQLGQRL